ncbi:hypothetical protein Tco_0471360 [Tanacetum coccineum]
MVQFTPVSSLAEWYSMASALYSLSSKLKDTIRETLKIYGNKGFLQSTHTTCRKSEELGALCLYTVCGQAGIRSGADRREAKTKLSRGPQFPMVVEIVVGDLVDFVAANARARSHEIYRHQARLLDRKTAAHSVLIVGIDVTSEDRIGHYAELFESENGDVKIEISNSNNIIRALLFFLFPLLLYNVILLSVHLILDGLTRSTRWIMEKVDVGCADDDSYR